MFVASTADYDPMPRFVGGFMSLYCEGKRTQVVLVSDPFTLRNKTEFDRFTRQMIIQCVT